MTDPLLQALKTIAHLKTFGDDVAEAIRTTQQENTMIEVGKIVLGPARITGYETEPSKDVAVSMSEEGLHLHGSLTGTSREKLYPNNGLKLTPEAAIEFAQLILKAAELQPEYAKDKAKLNDEVKRVEDRYKDLANGIGLDDSVPYEVDVTDPHSTFVVSKALK